MPLPLALDAIRVTGRRGMAQACSALRESTVARYRDSGEDYRDIGEESIEIPGKKLSRHRGQVFQ